MVGFSKLAEAHLPTGFITLAEVVRLAITGFGIRPMRDDWAEVLDHAQAASKAS